MSTSFGGFRFVLPFGVNTTVLPAVASTAISIGDLLYYDGTNVKPLSALTGGASAAIDQVTVSLGFAGVAQQGRIAAQTTAGGYAGFPISGILINTDCIYEADCASATFGVGDLVGPISDGLGAAASISDQSVVGVANGNSAIGYVVQKYTSATTKVRVRLLGVNQTTGNANPTNRIMGGGQIVGPGTLAAAATTTLTVASAALQVGTPTAGVQVNLPALASSKGLVFYIVNLAPATHAMTVKNPAAATIGSVAATKTGIFFCDGTAWYATIGS